MKVSLTDICDFQGGTQPPKDEWIDQPAQGYVRMLQIRDFTQSDKNYIEYVKDTGKLKTCIEDDILIGRYGASIGKILTGLAGAYNVAIVKTIPDEKVVSKKYLYWYLNSQYFQRFISNVGSRAAQAGFNKNDLGAAQIPLVDKERQEEICEVLEKANKLISLRKQQLAKLDELIKARFVEMFGDSVANTKNFPSTTLETVMTVFPQNGLYKPQTDYVQDDTGIPILRIDAFYNGKVTNWNTLKRLICSETEIDRYLLKENDIVINRVNSIEYLGKCAHIVGLKEKTVFESNMMRFHMDEKKVNAVYVTEVLCTEDIYRQILRRAKKSVNQASINQEDVKSLEILVPPLSLQNQFAAFVERVDQQKQTVQQSLEKLELMKKALMQEYFG